MARKQPASSEAPKTIDLTPTKDAMAVLSVLDAGSVNFEIAPLNDAYTKPGEGPNCLYVRTEHFNQELVDGINEMHEVPEGEIADVYAQRLTDEDTGEDFVGIIMPQLSSVEAVRNLLTELDDEGYLSDSLRIASQQLGERTLQRASDLGEWVIRSGAQAVSSPKD